MFTPRNYQETAIKEGLEYFLSPLKATDKVKPILVLPTAAGKSIIVANIALGLDADVVVFQPSRELLLQNYAKYIAYGGEASLFSTSLKTCVRNKKPMTEINGELVPCKEVGKVTFATIGSVKNCPELFKSVRYVIIDECDQYNPDKDGMYNKFFAALGIKRVLGLTATPFRLKTSSDPFELNDQGYPKKITQLKMITRIRPKFFNRLIHITQIRELYDKGYLTPLKYISLKWDSSDLKLNSTGAEYEPSSVKLAMRLNGILEKVPKIIKQALEKGRKHNLVFVDSITSAKELASKVEGSVYISGEMDTKLRAKHVQQFLDGEMHTMFNVGTLTTGFDFPNLDNIIVARPTTSLRLIYQIYGRGIRLAEGFQSYEESKHVKPNCTIVDLCDNLRRFGRLEDWHIGIHPEHGLCMYDLRRDLPLTMVDIIP